MPRLALPPRYKYRYRGLGYRARRVITVSVVGVKMKNYWGERINYLFPASSLSPYNLN